MEKQTNINKKNLIKNSVYIPMLFIIGLFAIIMEKDFPIVVFWWLVIEILGIIAYPLTRTLFIPVVGSGWFASKMIGITVLSVCNFFIATFLPVKPSLLLLILIMLFFVIIFASRKQYQFTTKDVRAWLIQALIFLSVLLVFSWIRGVRPQIDDLEKYMDFGFVNAVLRAKTLPVQDMWFAGEPINYYYFGQYITAILSRLTGISPAISYNLMIATISTVTLTVIGGLVRMVYLTVQPKQKIAATLAGGTSGLLASVGGSLHTIIYAVILPKLNEKGLYKAGEELKAYWFSNATRYIGYNPETTDKTIHEFPFYSFAVSDLHGHYIDLIFVVTYVTVLFLYYYKRAKQVERTAFICVHEIVLSILLGAMIMTNTWDFAICGLLLIFAYLTLWIQQSRTMKQLGAFVLQGMKVAVLSIVVASPFLLNFKNFSGGVGIVRAQTPFYQLMVLWGYQLLILLLFVSIKLVPNCINRVRINKRKAIQLDSWMTSLGVVAIILVLLPEAIYIIDIMSGGDYHRANTMFKFTYQAFMLFGIVGGYMTFRLLLKKKKRWMGLTAGSICVVLIGLALIYPFYAVSDRYGKISEDNYKGLDGLAYFNDKQEQQEYLQVIEWMNSNIKNQPVMIEANADKWSRECIVSMATGIPTVVGWVQHEWLWRNSYELANNRSEEIKTFYTTPEQAPNLIEKYNIQYIILGAYEREKYEITNDEPILALGETVFKSGNTYVIEVN